MNTTILIVFFAALSIQLSYWIVIMISMLRYRKISSENQSKDGVSVIVCANNEKSNLQQLIPKLLKQNYGDYEVIIVNDRSNDGSYDYLLDIKGGQLKVVNIDSTPNHIDPKKYAITLGIKAAKNDIVLFTDADCYPNDEDWINCMAGAMSNKSEFVLGYSQYNQGKGLLNALIRFETRMSGILYTAFAICGNPYMGVGRNLAYRKSLFLEKKGFNKFQSLTGGDDDLMVNRYANGKNTSVVLGKSALTWSYPKKSLISFLKQKIRHISVSKFYSFKDKFLLGLYSLCYLLIWISFTILAIENVHPEYIYSAFSVRIIILGVIVNITSKTFGERINIWLIPVMDLVFALYLFIVGIASIFTKRIKWR